MPTYDHCKCTRCKNIHLRSERKYSKPDSNGMTTLLCPKCGGESFYTTDSEGRQPLEDLV